MSSPDKRVTSAHLPPPGEAANPARAGRPSVLDPSLDAGLAAIAALTAQVFGVPEAMVSLLDERGEFTGGIGHGIALARLDTTLYRNVLDGQDVLVVPDATLDKRFARDPVVEGGHARFFAGAPLRGVDGHALGVLCIVDQEAHELTEQQRAMLDALGRQAVGQIELRSVSRALLESEAQRRIIFRSCPAALLVTRANDQAIVDVNDAFSNLLGWTREEVLGRTVEELALTNSAAGIPLPARLGEVGTVRDHELHLRARNGDSRHVLMASEPIDLRGAAHAITTLMDITARKEAEAVAYRLAAIVESSDDAIIGTDLSGIVTSWNRGAEAIFGYSDSDMVGTSITRIVPKDRLHEETRILGLGERGVGVTHMETLRRAKGGRLLDVSITTSPIRGSSGEIVGVSKIARDISDRKAAEERQRTSEARYQPLFDHAPDGILIADGRSVYLDANPSICRMLGYSHDELVGMHASDIVVPSELEHVAPALRAITSNAGHQREWTFRRKDGTTFQADVIGAMMPDGNLLGLVRDTTERSRYEARFRRLVESNVQGVMFWNASGVITAANDAFLHIIGRSREDLDAHHINTAMLTPSEYAVADATSHAEIAERGVCTPYEKELLRGNGTRVAVLFGAAAFADNPDEGVAFVLDLTDRKKLEQQFFRAQRMESIGTLAGGIAHDLNNVLAPILLAVGVLKAEIHDVALAEMIDTVESAAERGAALVQQVLSFARGVEGRQVQVDPIRMLRDVVKVARDTFPRSISVHFESPEGAWNVLGDPSQIHQVFMNLVVNARDAMPGGGTLTLQMENVVLDDTYAAMNLDARAGNFVMVTVSDTGGGIAPGLRERIFEPFFTTKEVGKGTGLGLSTALAITKGHGGFIHLYSELGRGSQFKIYLPADSSSVASGDARVESKHLPRGHGELIMIVDDEASVRAVARATLERFGYRALLASNGAEAVALFAVNRSEIAAVLTDMAMPIMDGPATIIALKSIDPQVKIIGSSGLTFNGAEAKAGAAGVSRFVPKPYTAETLLRTLAEILRDPEDA